MIRDNKVVIEFINVSNNTKRYRVLEVTEDEQLSGINVTPDYVAGYLSALDDSGKWAGWDINIIDESELDGCCLENIQDLKGWKNNTSSWAKVRV